MISRPLLKILPAALLVFAASPDPVLANPARTGFWGSIQSLWSRWSGNRPAGGSLAEDAPGSSGSSDPGIPDLADSFSSGGTGTSFFDPDQGVSSFLGIPAPPSSGFTAPGEITEFGKDQNEDLGTSDTGDRSFESRSGVDDPPGEPGEPGSNSSLFGLE